MFKYFKPIYILIVLILLLICGFFAALTYFQGDWRHSYEDIRIPELFVCSDPDQVIQSKQDTKFIVSGSQEYIYACGELVTESPIELGFYLFKEPKSKSIENNPAGEKYNAGWFNQQMFLPEENRQGHYRIDVYLFRDIIASTEFDVINP
jgi:hypothetical protein